jgi:hypothetical protein
VGSALFFAFVTATGCSNNGYGSASVSAQTGDPSAVLDFAGAISIPEGSAASAHIDLMSQSNKVLTGGNIQSPNPSVLQIVGSSTDPSGYVFMGVSAGTATVQVTVNGQEVQTVVATVLPPPASSLPPTIDAGIEPVVSVDAGPPDAGATSADD